MSIALTNESDSVTLLTSTTSAANTVNIVLNVAWWIKVDDKRDTFNIKASCRNISRDESFEFSCFEAIQCPLPITLVFVSMNG